STPAMEYDNDRLRKRRPQVETFYWVMLILLQPMTNWLLSPFTWLWPFLLMVSLLVFPAYVIYSRIMGNALSLPGRRWFPFLLTLSSFLVIQAFLLCVYSLFGKIIGAPMNGFFALTTKHLIREGWWTIVNMALAMAIFYIRKADDEKDM